MLKKNGETVQHGNTRGVLFSFGQIITYVSQYFKLLQGDLIYRHSCQGRAC